MSIEAAPAWSGRWTQGISYGGLGLPLAFVALPMLQGFGYAPGSRNDQGLNALTLAYCLLPCALKLVAAGLLYATWIRHFRSNE